jgi:hypothetical protein
MSTFEDVTLRRRRVCRSVAAADDASPARHAQRVEVGASSDTRDGGGAAMYFGLL